MALGSIGAVGLEVAADGPDVAEDFGSLVAEELVSSSRWTRETVAKSWMRLPSTPKRR